MSIPLRSPAAACITSGSKFCDFVSSPRRRPDLSYPAALKYTEARVAKSAKPREPLQILFHALLCVAVVVDRLNWMFLIHGQILGLAVHGGRGTEYESANTGSRKRLDQFKASPGCSRQRILPAFPWTHRQPSMLRSGTHNRASLRGIFQERGRSL